MSVIDVTNFYETYSDDAVSVRCYLDATICKTRHEFVRLESENNVCPRIEETRCINFFSHSYCAS